MTVAPVPATRPRLVGLDGIRGLAALFVVLNHVFLRAFPGYPADHAPFWIAGFIDGRFAVVVFIVLSGFSLSVSAARAGWRLDGVANFARRRAWRILPPYWAALGFSLLMTWLVVAQPGWPVPTEKSVAVNGLLVQDAFAAPSPNRAFWSIAIEAQLYIVFPLLILAMRRLNAFAMVATVAAPVLALGICSAAHVRDRDQPGEPVHARSRCTVHDRRRRRGDPHHYRATPATGRGPGWRSLSPRRCSR